jgi:hypothetical protein
MRFKNIVWLYGKNIDKVLDIFKDECGTFVIMDRVTYTDSSITRVKEYLVNHQKPMKKNETYYKDVLFITSIPAPSCLAFAYNDNELPLIISKINSIINTNYIDQTSSE